MAENTKMKPLKRQKAYRRKMARCDKAHSQFDKLAGRAWQSSRDKERNLVHPIPADLMIRQFPLHIRLHNEPRLRRAVETLEGKL